MLLEASGRFLRRQFQNPSRLPPCSARSTRYSHHTWHSRKPGDTKKQEARIMAATRTRSCRNAVPDHEKETRCGQKLDDPFCYAPAPAENAVLGSAAPRPAALHFRSPHFIRARAASAQSHRRSNGLILKSGTETAGKRGEAGFASSTSC